MHSLLRYITTGLSAGGTQRAVRRAALHDAPSSSDLGRLGNVSPLRFAAHGDWLGTRTEPSRFAQRFVRQEALLGGDPAAAFDLPFVRSGESEDTFESVEAGSWASPEATAGRLTPSNPASASAGNIAPPLFEPGLPAAEVIRRLQAYTAAREGRTPQPEQTSPVSGDQSVRSDVRGETDAIVRRKPATAQSAPSVREPIAELVRQAGRPDTKSLARNLARVRRVSRIEEQTPTAPVLRFDAAAEAFQNLNASEPAMPLEVASGGPGLAQPDPNVPAKLSESGPSLPVLSNATQPAGDAALQMSTPAPKSAVRPLSSALEPSQESPALKATHVDASGLPGEVAVPPPGASLPNAVNASPAPDLPVRRALHSAPAKSPDVIRRSPLPGGPPLDLEPFDDGFQTAMPRMDQLGASDMPAQPNWPTPRLRAMSLPPVRVGSPAQDVTSAVAPQINSLSRAVHAPYRASIADPADMLSAGLGQRGALPMVSARMDAAAAISAPGRLAQTGFQAASNAFDAAGPMPLESAGQAMSQSFRQIQASAIPALSPTPMVTRAANRVSSAAKGVSDEAAQQASKSASQLSGAVPGAASTVAALTDGATAEASPPDLDALARAMLPRVQRLLAIERERIKGR